ncbi:MAG TPA: class I SAM-dependent methyltransferase, partial [Chloroflexota bacterium]|nr:class I SAM-dependent methyltransferase [Chloroflexota bacterium]
LGAMDLLTIYLGDRLGLYRALVAGGPASAAALAARAGTAERYTREWLEQQAAGGILDVDDPALPAERRRYALSAGHAEVLTERDSLNYLAYLGRFAAGLGGAAPAIAGAFRSGAGVSWADLGPDLREGQAEQNRPIFLNLMGRAWLPAIPELDARLRRGAPTRPRVADIACGGGWSSIAIALAYPEAEVDGYDLDAPSIALARANAAARGVADRVRFRVADAASDAAPAGAYDLVLICEALHDLSDPVGALRTMRRLVAPGGAVLVVDERVAEAFTAPADDLERLMYGFSVLCCLPNGLAAQPSAATGTVMRPDTLRRYAAAAGFGAVEILPIEHDLFRLYRLRP